MAFFLLGAAACDSTAKVTDSEQTTHGADASATESDSAIETAAETEVKIDSETENKAETTSDKETETELTQTVDEKEGEAKVMSSNGFNYTARGYSSVVGNTFTFNQGFEITFPENYFADSFNRIRFSYKSTAPMKVYVYYTLDGAPAEDYFFLDAFKDSFLGLIGSYLDGISGAKLEKVVFNTCEKKDATLELYGISTEAIPLYEDDLCVENDRFKIGVRLSWGGAMTYFEDKKDGIADLGNLVNIHDTGRLIQQSFYGTYSNGEYVSGTQSGGAIWPYNPVQGGDKKNNGSRRLIDVAVGEDYIYIVSQALDWGFDNNISFCYYENRYTVKEDYVLVDNVATDYSGWKHRSGGQEIPAVYLVSYFDTLCYYNGAEPWTKDKEGLYYVDNLGGWSESGSYYFAKGNDETWATWINTEDNFAFGIYCPNVDKLIAIRHQYNGSKDPMNNSTVYVAPSNSITMQAFKPIVYSYILATGNPDDVREVFTENKDFTANPSLNEDRDSQRVSLAKLDMTNIDFTDENTYEILCGKSNTAVSYNAEEKATQFLLTAEQDPYVTLSYTTNSDRILSADDYNTVEFEYMIPTENGRSSYTTVLFLGSGDVKKATEGYTVHTTLIKDGQYHTASLYLPDSKWSGEIHLIRFDFFDSGSVGDRLFIKSFRFSNQAEMAVDNDLSIKGSEKILTSRKYSQVVFDESEGCVSFLPTGEASDVSVELNFANLALLTDQYDSVEIEYMLPEANSRDEYSVAFYYCAGEAKSYSGAYRVSSSFKADGEYHTVRIDFFGKNGWSGLINKLRFDYFEGGFAQGDKIFIKRITLRSTQGIDIDVSKQGSENCFSVINHTKVYFDNDEEALALEVKGNKDVGVYIGLGDRKLKTEDYSKLIISYMLPKTNSQGEYSCCLYFQTDESGDLSETSSVYGKLTVDGKYHTIVIDLSSKATWKGIIKNLRFDYFQSNNANGDVMFIKSITLK